MKKDKINAGLDVDYLFTDEEREEDLTEDQLNEKGFKITNTLLYNLFLKSAYRLLQKPLIVFRILKKAVARLQKYESVQEFAQDAKDRLQVLIRMVRVYINGEYTHISKTNAALSLAAILYFLSPIDLIPDFLPVGLLDDMAILTWVYLNFQSEIEGFLEWEDQNMLRFEIK
ncbi:YkvA family protein [Aureispira]|nr:YkvA family protein [Aureispira sp.]